MKNFRTYQMALVFYRNSQKLKLKGPAKNQFERAALSIVLNLSEGSSRPSTRERKRFYFTSLGSLREVQTILDLYGTPSLIAQADRLGGLLYRLCHSNG